MIFNYSCEVCRLELLLQCFCSVSVWGMYLMPDKTENVNHSVSAQPVVGLSGFYLTWKWKNSLSSNVCFAAQPGFTCWTIRTVWKANGVKPRGTRPDKGTDSKHRCYNMLAKYSGVHMKKENCSKHNCPVFLDLTVTVKFREIIRII